MKRKQLIIFLCQLIANSEIYYETPFSLEGDPEAWHIMADDALLAYIDDAEISDLFRKITKWYA